MANIYNKTKGKGITLPAPPPKDGVYAPIHEFETNLLYYSDCGPDLDDSAIIGKLGRDLIVEEGQKAVYDCTLNLLANIETKIGDLNKIKRFVKVLALVNNADDFVQQPQIVNGASNLSVELFGEEIGYPARSAIGTDALPGGIAYGIEVLLEVEVQNVFHLITEYNIFGALSL